MAAATRNSAGRRHEGRGDYAAALDAISSTAAVAVPQTQSQTHWRTRILGPSKSSLDTSDLALDLGRVDSMAGVRRRDDPMDLQLTVRDRDLGRRGDVAAKAHDLGQA